MENMNFNKLEQSFSYVNKFDYNGKTYHYANATLIECQMLHLFTTFLEQIGIDTVHFDYDEETQVSYCNSLYSKDEKFIEMSVKCESDDYNLENIYFAYKKDIEKYKNYDELLKQLCKGYFIAALFDDSDKNTGYVIDKNKNISISSYYDFGSLFLIDSQYSYSSHFSDAFFDDNLRIEYNISKEDADKEFEQALDYYIKELKECMSNVDHDKIIMDCLPNIPLELMDKIIDFDFEKLLENDYHTYKENSKKVLRELFNTMFSFVKPKVKKYRELLVEQLNKKDLKY